MIDVKAHKEFLKTSLEFLNVICLAHSNDEISFEHDEPYSAFTDSASNFHVQFKYRAAMYDEPQFKNARSDAELKRAAIERKFEAQKILNEFNAKDQRDRWREKPILHASEILHDVESSEENMKALLDDSLRAVIAEAQLAECDVIIKAIERKEESENV